MTTSIKVMVVGLLVWFNVYAAAQEQDKEAAQTGFTNALAGASAKSIAGKPMLRPIGAAIADTFPTKDSIERIQLGPVLVIQWKDPLYFSETIIVVDSQEKKGLVTGILKAAFPKNMSMPVDENGAISKVGSISVGIASLEYPAVFTINEYVENLRKGDEENRKVAPRGPRAPVPEPFDAEKKRAEIKKDLGDNFAVVYRYVGKKEK